MIHQKHPFKNDSDKAVSSLIKTLDDDDDDDDIDSTL